VAWTSAQLGTSVQSAYNSDKPILFAHNVLESTTQSAWRTWTGASPADYTGYTVTATNYDAADASYPLYRLWDNKTQTQTKAALPGALTDTDRWAMLFKGPASTFDSIAVLNHNFGALSNFYGYNYNPARPSFYVRVHIADDDEFTSNVRLIHTWTNPSSDKPLIAFNLSYGGTDFLQYSLLTNAQVSLICDGQAMGTGTGQPKAGEILFGKRVQLRHQASVPYMDNGLYADAVTQGATTGQFRRYARSSGGIRFENNYNITGEHDDLVTWFETYISHGMKYFLYVPRPTRAVASPYEAYWVALEDTDFSLDPVDGPLGYALTLTMKEVAPYHARIT